MAFPLTTYAYYACDENDRRWYDTRNAPRVVLEECCVALMSGDYGRADAARCCETAAANGHVRCLRAARRAGLAWDAGTCARAAENGHLACLEYAHRHGCPWDADVTYAAAADGHLACLAYARDRGCAWDRRACAAAAAYQHADCLEYALANGCVWDDETSRLVVEHLSFVVQ